jgi:hypothetical protein
VRLILSIVLATCPVLACSGKTLSSGGSPDAAPEGGSGDGAACVNVELSSYDQSCNVDSDCVEITSGTICNGSCECGGSVINIDGQARYQSQVAGITASGCPCAYPGNPACVNHTCTLCEPGAGGSCGVTTDDAGPPPGDAAACVNIDVTTYDQSCTTSADCVEITSGMVCTGDCTCGGAVINVDGQSRYDQQIAGIMTGLCACPTFGEPVCVQDRCVLCLGPDPAAGCPDGG